MTSQTGIRQRELCERLGLDYKTVAVSAKQRGLSTHAYLQQETGWILKDELYYPPDTQLADQPSEQETKSSPQRRRWLDFLGLFGLGIILVLAITLVNEVGIQQIRAQVKQLGILAPFALWLLRSVSIVIPAIPSTAYSVLAGTLFGFWEGIMVIAVADLMACSLSFYLAKRYGRGLVQRLVGQRFMGRVDSFSSNYLETNPFLVAGFLMTGLFDFVSYAVGLTKMQWRKFLPALLLGIAVSTPPIVALGAGIFTGGKWLLGLALLGMFALALLTGWLHRRHSKNQS
jgi:uncharacterized membrane protein YdjX (TVP38/TMEM64 family)